MQLRTSIVDPHRTEQNMSREEALTRLSISDYVALTKPRIISLLLVTTLVPMFLAGPTAPSPLLIFWVMLGGFLAAGGANTINQYVDRDIDHVMLRTRKRPLPGGRMTPNQVLLFGVGLSLLSFVLALGDGQSVDSACWRFAVSSSTSSSIPSCSNAIAPRTSWWAARPGPFRPWSAGPQWPMSYRCCPSSSS